MKKNKFLLGLGVGTVLGLLLAPKKGSELVEDIKVGSKKAYSKAKSLTKEDVADMFNETIVSIKTSINEFDANEFKETTKSKLNDLTAQLELLKSKVVSSDEFNYVADALSTCAEMIEAKVSIILSRLKSEELEDLKEEIEDEIEEATNEIEDLIKEMSEEN